MTNAQELAKELAIDLHYMEHPGGTGKPRFIPDGWDRIITVVLAQVEAETLRVYREHIARNLGLDHNLMFQRSFTKREIINALDEAEIVMDGQQAQRAKEGEGMSELSREQVEAHLDVLDCSLSPKASEDSKLKLLATDAALAEAQNTIARMEIDRLRREHDCDEHCQDWTSARMDANKFRDERDQLRAKLEEQTQRAG